MCRHNRGIMPPEARESSLALVRLDSSSIHPYDYYKAIHDHDAGYYLTA